MYPDAYQESNKLSTDGLVKGSRLPLNELDKSIAHLHEVIKMLEQKLTPILAPEYHSEDNSTQAQEVPPISPLAAQLNTNNEGIYRAAQRLTNLMDRAEC